MKIHTKFFSRFPEPFVRKASIILLLLNIYVIFGTLLGPNNISSYYRTEGRIKTAKQELDAVLEQNAEYEKEIKMLRGDTLDQDYLEELVREQLNYSYPDEKVIIHNHEKSGF